MILFKGCDLYAPAAMGRRDVLIAGGKIVAIGDDIPEPRGIGVEVLSARDQKMVPGLIDGHVHIAGAGGEGGPSTRTPEVRLSQLLEGGITTVVGCLGTDGLTRTVESVLMKAKALRAEGVSAWIYTGSYQVPTPTILGDVGKDLALIDEVIGVGEVAISDHRGSGPTVEELIRLAGHARVGGMLGGKAGIVNLHMGDAKDPFRPIHDVVARSELAYTQFLPTHCTRNGRIFEEAKEYGKAGYVDITAGSFSAFPEKEIKPSRAIPELLEAGVPLEHITMTSDGCGSLPKFDEKGDLVGLEVGRPRAILDAVVDAVREEGLGLDTAIGVVTENPARILKLPGKGRIEVGADADLVLLDEEYRVHHLVANGKLLIRDATMLERGTFE